MASDLRRRWVHTLTNHLVFSFQANVFIPEINKVLIPEINKVQRGVLKFREYQVKEVATFLSWAVSCSQGQVVFCCSLEHKGPDASTCPQAVIFSSAPGGRLFSQKSRWALSVGSETKALTYALLAKLIPIYLKLKFSNSQVLSQSEQKYLKMFRGQALPHCV